MIDEQSAADRSNPGQQDAGHPSKDAAETPVSENVRRQRRKKQRNNKAGKGKAPAPAPEVIEIRPIARRARAKRRHWYILLSFYVFVVMPLVLIAYYLWAVAYDQYASTTGFTVRQEEGGSASSLVTGLSALTGGSSGADSDILYEFVRSQEIVRAIDDTLDLRTHYQGPWPDDRVFAIWPDASIEDLHWYWGRVVRVSYDQATGLMEVRVLAFDPDVAQQIAIQIVAESQDKINELNEQLRADAMGYAERDLNEALERLKRARQALTDFRTRTRIVDPDADIQGRMGVMNNLQQNLASALIEYDLLRETTSENDPRIRQATRRIQVIRDRIISERQNFTSDDTSTGGVGEDYPSLISEFEALTVEREFAQETYRAALEALDVARDNAARQSRYLAAYIQPTRPETAEFPQRFTIIGLAALFLLLAWSILTLVYYSIRDRG
ncbi:MAG: sugar transporter [Pseudomonadota bacterium]